MQINALGTFYQASSGPATAPSAKASAAVAVATPTADEAQLQEAVRVANRSAASISCNIEFSVDPRHGKNIVRVVDTGTGKLVRQIPSEEMLAITVALDRLQGMLLRQKA